MYNINNTVTTAFLKALSEDKSKITSIKPEVIFRNILGLGDNIDTAEVVKALQKFANQVGKLRDFQRNFINPSYVGEVITFDIGSDPAWVRFKIIREPLKSQESRYAINFITEVKDDANYKVYTRLVGAISPEQKDGKTTTIFRTISDMCETTDIERPQEPQKEEPKAEEAEDTPEEVPQEHETPAVEAAAPQTGSVSVIVPTADNNEKEAPATDADDPEVETAPEGETVMIEKGAECLVTTDIAKGTFTITPCQCGCESITINVGPGVALDKRLGFNVAKFKCVVDVTHPVITDHNDESILEYFERMQEELVFKEGEIIEVENVEGKFRVLKDVTVTEWEHVGKNYKLFTEPVKEENMNDIVYHKGDKVEVEGAEYLAIEDVTIGMIRENGGDLSKIEQLQPINKPVPDATSEAAPVGDIPNCKLCKDEHTTTEYMKMLFGTPSPTILHVLNLIRRENEASAVDSYLLTGTSPTEQMIVFSDYTFSVVRMKNGCYYRIWVAHTDMNLGADGCWLKTHDTKDRWFKVGDVTDRDINRICNMRR